MREKLISGTIVSRVCRYVPKIPKNKILITATTVLLTSMSASHAVPVDGARDEGNGVVGLDPLTIPKYVTPLLIPPAMPKKCMRRDGHDRTKELTKSYGHHHCRVDYEIAVRQFEQQILPEGFPKTTVWGYGSTSHPGTVAEGGTFNYPAFTIEARNNRPTTIRWVNDLVDPETKEFLPHLLNGSDYGGLNGTISGAVDQTLHWANPVRDCLANGTDCAGTSAKPYIGPVPIVTHLHGAHVGPESDGYPEAWWLPAARNIPKGTATRGTLWDQAPWFPKRKGEAVFQYPNTQPSSILWYHDHTLGMTRLNVYAGPAGFYMLRNKKGGDDGIDDDYKLPGPAPQLGDAPGTKYYDIPIVIQDRSFYKDGSLFYPKDRAFFEGLEVDQLKIPFAPDPDSDIAPLWNPEAFFNTMVVNGNTWPYLDVDRTRYRFRLLNGTNSRFLNLSLQVFNSDGTPANKELPFWVIGAEQGMLSKVVRVRTGNTRVFWDEGEKSAPGNRPRSARPHPDQALLMAPAERFDVIVNFRPLKAGQKVRMINTAPDSPFGGFPDTPADPDTSGQVMEFHVGKKRGPTFSNPKKFDLEPEPSPPDPVITTRYLSLNEEGSLKVCAIDNDGVIEHVPGAIPNDDETCSINGEPVPGAFQFGPKAALLGTDVKGGGSPTPQLWSDPLTQNPGVGDTEVWELWNYTADSHPIHLHLVTFEVLDRFTFDPVEGNRRSAVEPWETGRKDTVISYPGEVTVVKANFDIPGLYVWHCHIVEHEDNEMMLPFCVGNKNKYCAGL